jgi:hypothetical protein
LERPFAQAALQRGDVGDGHARATKCAALLGWSPCPFFAPCCRS